MAKPINTAHFPRANNRDQRRGALHQMPTKETGPGTTTTGGADAKYGQHPRPRGKTVDETLSEDGQQQGWAHGRDSN